MVYVHQSKTRSLKSQDPMDNSDRQSSSNRDRAGTSLRSSECSILYEGREPLNVGADRESRTLCRSRNIDNLNVLSFTWLVQSHDLNLSSVCAKHVEEASTKIISIDYLKWCL
jgi:hypothetical protein